MYTTVLFVAPSRVCALTVETLDAVLYQWGGMPVLPSSDNVLDTLKDWAVAEGEVRVFRNSPFARRTLPSPRVRHVPSASVVVGIILLFARLWSTWRYAWAHVGGFCCCCCAVQMFHAILVPSAREAKQATGPLDPATGATQIFVTGLSGKTYTVQVDLAADTVFVLKRKIMAKEPVPVAVQKLVFGGAVARVCVCVEPTNVSRLAARTLTFVRRLIHASIFLFPALPLRT